MIEIKFRAWVVDKFEKDENTPKTFKMHDWHSEFFSDMSPVTFYGSNFPEPDDPCVILMQYTGLKDSKNQEIYEGDIVSFPSNLNDFYSIMRQDFNETVHDIVITEIRFDNGGFTFDYQFGYEGREVDWKDIEIIGNIHENPELLGE